MVWLGLESGWHLEAIFKRRSNDAGQARDASGGLDMERSVFNMTVIVARETSAGLDTDRPVLVL